MAKWVATLKGARYYLRTNLTIEATIFSPSKFILVQHFACIYFLCFHFRKWILLAYSLTRSGINSKRAAKNKYPQFI